MSHTSFAGTRPEVSVPHPPSLRSSDSASNPWTVWGRPRVLESALDRHFDVFRRIASCPSEFAESLFNSGSHPVGSNPFGG